MGLNETVSFNIRILRLKRRMSQEKLADLMGVNRNYVGMIERGESSPTVSILEKAAKALDVEPAELMREEKR